MKVMPRNQALTVITDDLLIKDLDVYFKSPCFRALFIRDGVKGYARKLYPKGYLFIADDSMPDVLWFKETNDKITRLEGFYI